MEKTDTVFAGSIPALYERYMGPLLFEPYAADLAARLAGVTAGRVLETAAGTGILTRQLAHTLSDAVAIVATDLNQPMLDFAAAQLSTPRVMWQQADAQRLPFGDSAFDAVICQFGVMFFPDKRTAYREALRMLKPGGCFVFSVWDRLEENEIANLVNEAIAGLFPGDPPQFFARTPHGYHDLDAIRDELAEVGFSVVDAETVQKLSLAVSPRDAVTGLCQGTPLRNEIEARKPVSIEEATEAAANSVAARFGPGPVRARMQAHVITAAR
jgi:ubiquinone/menaquinone biosynthesis C-methylase UbiE